MNVLPKSKIFETVKNYISLWKVKFLMFGMSVDLSIFSSFMGKGQELTLLETCVRYEFTQKVFSFEKILKNIDELFANL